MENTYSIKDLINLFLSKLWLIILLAVIGGAAGFCYTKFCMPLQYSSHISMYVQCYTSTSGPTDYNDISKSKQLINTYIEVLKDDAVMNAVGGKLMNEFDESVLTETFGAYQNRISPSVIRNCMHITSVTDTSVLTVSSTTKSPEIAAAICNDIAEVAPKFLDDAIGVGQINYIDTAKVYPNPVGPNIKKNTALGAIAGAMLMALLILIIDFFDNTFKDPETLREKYKKAVVGEIQEYSSGKKKKGEDDHFKLTDENVPFYITESYKSLRTNISFALATSDKKIFAVSSANPSEGKSTVSANTAIALAQGGNKVLLIDADMRKSTQHKIFGLKNKKGLSTAVSKMDSIEDCITRNVVENLDVICSGPIPPNPSELLASDNMSELLEKLSAEYSAIIIDTPPINVVTDAMELARNISGIILVTCYGKTSIDDMDAAMKKIEFANMNLLGFILNSIKTKKNGKYYSKYKYKAGYGYGNSAETENDDDSEEDDDKVLKESNDNSKKNKKGKKGGK